MEHIESSFCAYLYGIACLCPALFSIPPVHLPLSVMLNSLDGAHRPHAFDTALSAVTGGLLPSAHRWGHTAAHKSSR